MVKRAVKVGIIAGVLAAVALVTAPAAGAASMVEYHSTPSASMVE